jgi:uncharacterized protein YciI
MILLKILYSDQMQKLITISSALFLTILMSAQVADPESGSNLAKKLGSDERGMKMYVLVLLKSGPNNEQDSVKRAKMFAGHFSNMNKMAEEKKLIVAGPLDNNEQAYRGIFILDVPGFEEAKTLLDNDPTVKEKIFEPEYYHWYGSAALPEYLDVDKKLRESLGK